ncbi:hypothetical protein LCGC14_0392570 [marine sediment metagenome]|uniref:Uncharacterized protein n=1 Tax=marine sediment metagenome TaxID=412755 RepID=A0A0F9VKY9_9ZZZZ
MIIGCWGEDKSCKTTFALTFPKPLVFMEFDIGGFDRAIYRFQEEFDSGAIKYEAFPMPMTFGKFDPAKLTVGPSKTIVGMKELFYKWAGRYIANLQDEKVATVVIDTATLLHSINADCYLQELQEKQLPINPVTGKGSDGKDLRSQLIQVEYREPNNRMRGILYNAKSAKKHLVLVHHADDEYKPMPQKDGSLAMAPTGKRKRKGFATLGDSADVIIHTYWDDQKMKPFAKVDLAEVKQLEGMVFETPTYDKISKVIKMIKGIS